MCVCVGGNSPLRGRTGSPVAEPSQGGTGPSILGPAKGGAGSKQPTGLHMVAPMTSGANTGHGHHQILQLQKVYRPGHGPRQWPWPDVSMAPDGRVTQIGNTSTRAWPLETEGVSTEE